MHGTIDTAPAADPRWPGLADLTVPRRWALALAVLGFAIYFSAVVGGSVLQNVLGLPWQMGWLQQIVSALVVLAVAAVMGRPAALLGLRRPQAGWFANAALVGLAIAAIGLIVDRITPTPNPVLGLEYFAYEATMPGIGEELGFRGLLLGLLLTFGLRRGWRQGGGWAMLAVAALPFAALHLLELSGATLATHFLYTFVAGLLLGWCRMRTGSLLPAMLAHNIANVTGGVVTLLFIG